MKYKNRHSTAKIAVERLKTDRCPPISIVINRPVVNISFGENQETVVALNKLIELIAKEMQTD
jgi:hypothetical protein